MPGTCLDSTAIPSWTSLVSSTLIPFDIVQVPTFPFHANSTNLKTDRVKDPWMGKT